MSKARRCAIYTRKSSEEGLEQDFNSLHAQRQACEAYVRSQQNEGWQLIKTAYDDGGLSGGTLERPALQRLFADIAQGQIDTVVVYKVDRLTRSLMDFSKIVEIFDKHGVSFVAVTQQFNTTTSMGRLTLNILLSFAQFEREVTGERIRDKIAASKKKGMWMGGVTPLGYEVKDRKLLINPGEAKTVRHIFERYLKLGSVQLLKAELARDNIRSKTRTYGTGARAGGNNVSRGMLYALLGNPIYVGEIRHKGQRYPGNHEPILERDLFEAAQAALREGGPGRRQPRKVESSPLLGKLFDEAGNRLTPSHTRNHGRRYRYYVSRPLITGEAKDKGWRLPAIEIEKIIAHEAATLLGVRSAITSALEEAKIPSSKMPSIIQEASRFRAKLQSETDRSAALGALIDRADLGEDTLRLAILMRPIAGTAATLTKTVPLKMKRRGVEMRLVIESDQPPPTKADTTMLKEISRAHRCFEALITGEASIGDLAKREGVDKRYISNVMPLVFLAPDIVEAISKGTQPAELTATALVRRIDLPVEWDAQRRQLGFKLR